MGPREEAFCTELNRLPAELREGAIAVTALLLARELDEDEGEISPRDKISYAREVRLASMTLRELAPGQVEGDKTDEKRERREARLKLVGGE